MARNRRHTAVFWVTDDFFSGLLCRAMMKTLTPTCSGLVWAEEEAEPAIPTPDSDVELGAVGSTLTSPEVLWPRPKGESLRSTPKATLQPIQTRYVKYIYAIISSVSLNKCK